MPVLEEKQKKNSISPLYGKDLASALTTGCKTFLTQIVCFIAIVSVCYKGYTIEQGYDKINLYVSFAKKETDLLKENKKGL